MSKRNHKKTPKQLLQNNNKENINVDGSHDLIKRDLDSSMDSSQKIEVELHNMEVEDLKLKLEETISICEELQEAVQKLEEKKAKIQEILQHKMKIEELIEPKTKKRRIENEVIDFSQVMPTEILLKIAKYFKGKGCLKTLTQTCKRFNVVFGSQLVLKLNFKEMTSETMDIQRSYEKICISGQDINPRHLENYLDSSSQTAKKLEISKPTKSAFKCKLYSRTLLQILSLLPKLQEITLSAVTVLVPLLNYDFVKDEEIPVMEHLKSLSFFKCNAESMAQCFQGAENIEKLSCDSPCGRDLKQLVFNQKQMKDLNIVTKFGEENYATFIEKSPLVSLKLKVSRHFGDSLKALKSSTIQSLNISLYFHSRIESFVHNHLTEDVNSIVDLKNFPALKNFNDNKINVH